MPLKKDIINPLAKIWNKGKHKEHVNKTKKKLEPLFNKRQTHLIVKVDGSVIYDCDMHEDIPEPLRITLQSYNNDFAPVWKKDSKNRDIAIYDIRPTVTSLFPSKSLETACLSTK